jgi:RNA polymerase sigma-70 factor, ECF subfamily
MQDVCTDAEMVELLRRARKGETAAYDRLYNLYADKVFRYFCARSGDREVAEDLTSDLFVKLIQVLPRFRVNANRPVASFSAWLYRIAGNLLMDHFRRQRLRNHLDIETQSHLAATDSPPLHRLAAAEDGAQLMAAISDLSEEQQSVVLFRFAEQMDVRSVAEVMGRTEGAVKALQHRALLQLRRLLSRNNDK